MIADSYSEIDRKIIVKHLCFPIIWWIYNIIFLLYLFFMKTFVDFFPLMNGNNPKRRAYSQSLLFHFGISWYRICFNSRVFCAHYIVNTFHRVSDDNRHFGIPIIAASESKAIQISKLESLLNVNLMRKYHIVELKRRSVPRVPFMNPILFFLPFSGT